MMREAGGYESHPQRHASSSAISWDPRGTSTDGLQVWGTATSWTDAPQKRCQRHSYGRQPQTSSAMLAGNEVLDLVGAETMRSAPFVEALRDKLINKPQLPGKENASSFLSASIALAFFSVS